MVMSDRSLLEGAHDACIRLPTPESVLVVDLATVSGRLKEAIANRQIAERRLDDLRREATSTLADRDVVREALIEIGGLTGLLASGEPAERARFYDAVGISGTYEPQVNRLILTTHPVGHMVRVGGGLQLRYQDITSNTVSSR